MADNEFENQNPPTPPQTTTPNSSTKEYVEDLKHMLDYCRDQGIAIPSSIESNLASILYSKGVQGDDPKFFEDVIRIHGKISGIIAPATPRSLVATQLSFKNKRAFPTYIFLIVLIVAAFIGLLGYVYTLTIQTTQKDTTPIDPNAPLVMTVKNQPQDANSTKAIQTETSKLTVSTKLRSCWYIQLNYVFAAILGAAFNGLLTSYKYLRNRSFDPNYLTVYLIRFVLGVLAGVVLANLWRDPTAGNATMAKLSPGIIALLGGYAAEAVRQILDRLVEVLVTAVRGKQDTASAERLEIAKDVLDINQTATASNVPQDVKEKLDGLLRKLKK